NTIVLLSMLMSLVMMVIGSNIARAFGLAGAMSIIRFRTVVKDTRDTAYVFYALAVGMACGTGNLMIAAFGGLLVGLFVGILHWTRHGSSGHSEFLLTFQQLPSDHEEQRRIYLPVFEQYFRSYDLVNVKSRKMGDVIKLSFMVTLKNPSDVDQIVGDLSGLEGLMKVNLHWGEKAEN
ncbi:MAG: DUF4956 domain-containing protein, partial [Candidatus Krumholzibacteria bacterium]|nr:DUF4956 domain-containing protein [Candidatus Krumholzibacteria bacterium]